MTSQRNQQFSQPLRNTQQEVSRSNVPRSNEEKAKFLSKETGMEVVMAVEFLGSNGWDLNEAFRGYRALVAHEEKLKKTHTPPAADNPVASPTTENSAQNNSLQVRSETDGKRKASRGFSVSNLNLLEEERSKQNQAVIEAENHDGYFEMLKHSSKTSFVLPDISMYDKETIDIIKQDLISKMTLKILTTAGRLNWWYEVGACRKLFPMSTVGDGNCLLHAVSLGMWGFHDRLLTLRRALYKTLQQPSAKKNLKRRWKYDLWMENMKTGGLTYTLEEWEIEWNTVIQLSCDKPRLVSETKRINRQASFTGSLHELEDGESLDSLESIHVYVLANLLCRPIIIIAEEMLKDHEGNPVAPIPFGGIYLPLERDPESCYKYPLILAYENAHFSALVPADGDNLINGEKVSSSVPLVDKDFFLLPVKYAINPGSTWDMIQDDSVKEERPEMTFQEKIALLRKYLDVVKVTLNSKANNGGKTGKDYRVGSVIDHVQDMFKGQNANVVIAAKLNLRTRPKNYKEMIDNFLEIVKKRVHQNRVATKRLCNQCSKTEGSPSLNGFCQTCYNNAKSKIDKSQNGKAASTQKNVIPPRKPNSPKNNSIENGLYQMTIYQDEPAKSHQNNHCRLDKPVNNVPPQEKNTIYYQPNQQTTRTTKTVNNPAVMLQNNNVRTASTCSLQQKTPAEIGGSLSLPRTSKLRSLEIGSSMSLPRIPHTPPSDEEYKRIGTCCRTSGCKFYGNNQTSGFCSGCYRQYNKRIPQY